MSSWTIGLRKSSLQSRPKILSIRIWSDIQFLPLHAPAPFIKDFESRLIVTKSNITYSCHSHVSWRAGVLLQLMDMEALRHRSMQGQTFVNGNVNQFFIFFRISFIVLKMKQLHWFRLLVLHCQNSTFLHQISKLVIFS